MRRVEVRTAPDGWSHSTPIASLGRRNRNGCALCTGLHRRSRRSWTIVRSSALRISSAAFARRRRSTAGRCTPKGEVPVEFRVTVAVDFAAHGRGTAPHIGSDRADRATRTESVGGQHALGFGEEAFRSHRALINDRGIGFRVASPVDGCPTTRPASACPLVHVKCATRRGVRCALG